MSKRKIKIWQIVLLSFIAILVVVRLMLPYIVTKYINKVLADMDGYKGSIQDVDIWLIRGAYVVKGLKIDKVNNKIPIPFVSVQAIDLSVDWKALLKGSIKAEVGFLRPILNFVAGPTEATSQTGAETDWTKPLKKLAPMDINRMQIINGKVTYNDFHASPKVDIFISDLSMLLTNISNVEQQGVNLPSSLKIHGTSVGKGDLNITGKLNLLKVVPDADINMQFTNINLTALNDFAKAYGKFDFERGNLSVYSEMSLANKNITGYVKPVIEKVDIVNWKEEEETFLQKLYQGAIGLVFATFKNHREDRFATKVPLQGTIEKVDANIWTTVVNIIRNAFVEAYNKSIDETVSFKKNEEEKKRSGFLGLGKKTKPDTDEGGSKQDKKEKKEKKNNDSKDKK